MFEESDVQDVVNVSEEVLQLILKLQPEEADEIIKEVCNKLIELVDANPRQAIHVELHPLTLFLVTSVRKHIVTHHGVIPIMEMLEIENPNREVILAILRVVNKVCFSHPRV